MLGKWPVRYSRLKTLQASGKESEKIERMVNQAKLASFRRGHSENLAIWFPEPMLKLLQLISQMGLATGRTLNQWK
jgi:hypothetical protein